MGVTIKQEHIDAAISAGACRIAHVHPGMEIGEVSFSDLLWAECIQERIDGVHLRLYGHSGYGYGNGDGDGDGDMEERAKYTTPPVLAEGPGWKLIYHRFEDGGPQFAFFEMRQPNGEAIWYSPESIAERLRTWDALIGAL